MQKYTLEELIAQCDPTKPASVLTEWDDMVLVGREIIDQKLIWMLGDVHGHFDHVLETVTSTGERPVAALTMPNPALILQVRPIRFPHNPVMYL